MSRSPYPRGDASTVTIPSSRPAWSTQAGGVGVGVGVHADDGVDGFCEHNHRSCCSLQRRWLTLAPAWVETPDGTSVMSHAFAGKLLIRPIGEPGRCRRTETTSQVQDTPKWPDA